MHDALTYHGRVVVSAVVNGKNKILYEHHNDVLDNMLKTVCEALAYGNVQGKTPLYLDLVRTHSETPNFESEDVESIILNHDYPSLQVESVHKSGATQRSWCVIFGATISNSIVTENLHTSDYDHYAVLRSNNKPLADVPLSLDQLSILSATVDLHVSWMIQVSNPQKDPACAGCAATCVGACNDACTGCAGTCLGSCAGNCANTSSSATFYVNPQTGHLEYVTEPNYSFSVNQSTGHLEVTES